MREGCFCLFKEERERLFYLFIYLFYYFLNFVTLRNYWAIIIKLVPKTFENNKQVKKTITSFKLAPELKS